MTEEQIEQVRKTEREALADVIWKLQYHWPETSFQCGYNYAIKQIVEILNEKEASNA